jgi:hypothetical protein
MSATEWPRPSSSDCDTRARRRTTLTERELEVFDLIGRGLNTARIAEQMGVSIKTIYRNLPLEYQDKVESAGRDRRDPLRRSVDRTPLISGCRRCPRASDAWVKATAPGHMEFTGSIAAVSPD